MVCNKNTKNIVSSTLREVEQLSQRAVGKAPHHITKHRTRVCYEKGILMGKYFLSHEKIKFWS